MKRLLVLGIVLCHFFSTQKFVVAEGNVYYKTKFDPNYNEVSYERISEDSHNVIWVKNQDFNFVLNSDEQVRNYFYIVGKKFNHGGCYPLVKQLNELDLSEEELKDVKNWLGGIPGIDSLYLAGIYCRE